MPGCIQEDHHEDYVSNYVVDSSAKKKLKLPHVTEMSISDMLQEIALEAEKCISQLERSVGKYTAVVMFTEACIRL